MVIKISDFGLTRDIYEDDIYQARHAKEKMPVRWMALESLRFGCFSEKSDVWSLGIVLYEMITGTTLDNGYKT